MSNNKPRIVIFDTESTRLHADIGHLLCVGWKVFGEDRVHMLKISDYDLFDTDVTDDFAVVKESAEALSQADALVGWYSAKHDIPLLNSQLLYHGLPILPPFTAATHIDCWRIARFKMRLTNNRLATVADFFGFEEKTKFDKRIWERAGAGYEDALKYVYDHCKQDVILTEQVYEKIRPLDRQHFNVNIITSREDACPNCGHQGHFQARGKNYAAVSWSQRYQCLECGKWCSGPPQRKKEIVKR